MRIELLNGKKITCVREEFESMFPYLRLEFIDKNFEINHKSKYIHDSNAVLKHKTNTLDGAIYITPETRFNELHQQISSIYGIKTSLFRKTGSSWIEAAYTSDWTLDEQNKQGEKISKNFQ